MDSGGRLWTLFVWGAVLVAVVILTTVLGYFSPWMYHVNQALSMILSLTAVFLFLVVSRAIRVLKEIVNKHHKEIRQLQNFMGYGE